MNQTDNNKLTSERLYVKDNTCILVQTSVRPAVHATFEAENYWKIHEDDVKYVGWRYIASKAGVFRMYPGAEDPKEFDYHLRSW